ncbi:MAG TPA: dihydrolipoamide acetyltransferase family protein [Actinomycetota bacterium]|nr:dihydrolipoamide acetyltransferase family protein [Actinomycetota bacterium]
MATPVQMPQMGESVVEGTILKWLKSEGDTIEMDDMLVEVSTDKVDTEIPSPVAGVLTKILAQEGDTVEVGTVICEVDESGEGAGTAGGSAQAEGPPQETTGEQVAGSENSATGASEIAGDAPVSADEIPDTPMPERPAAQADQPDGGEKTEPSRRASTATKAPERGGPPTRSGDGKPGQVLSPLVRRLAREHGVNLEEVEGTGQGGRVTKADVLGHAERQRTAPAAPQTPTAAPQQAKPAAAAPPVVRQSGEGTQVQPLSHIRRRIAEHMVKSLQTSARAWNAVEVDMENIAQLRKRVNPSFKEREGFSLTYTPFICRAVTDALAAHPLVNASVNEDLTEATLHSYVNLGIAVATDYGLIVPVIKGAEAMNVVGIARAIRDLAARARSKNLTPDEVGGSTFTITNPGPFGSYLSVPVINQPNVAILGTEAVEQRVAVVDGMIAIRHRMFLSMSWDHRLLDGSDAMEFLARLKQNLETWDFTNEVAPF